MTADELKNLQVDFADGWPHFCKCIDFGNSALDAQAIRFMNEIPQKINIALLESVDDKIKLNTIAFENKGSICLKHFKP